MPRGSKSFAMWRSGCFKSYCSRKRVGGSPPKHCLYTWLKVCVSTWQDLLSTAKSFLLDPVGSHMETGMKDTVVIKQVDRQEKAVAGAQRSNGHGKLSKIIANHGYKTPLFIGFIFSLLFSLYVHCLCLCPHASGKAKVRR